MKLNIRVVASLIAAGITLALAGTALAGHAWTSGAPIPDPDGLGGRTGRTEGACASEIGDKIYVAFGYDSGDSNLLRIYDIASDTWSFGPNGPAPLRSEGYQGVAHGGKLYCMGGRAGSPLPDLDSFNPATNTWTSLASMPQARAGTAAAGQGNGIYVFGGRTTTAPSEPACVGTIAPGASTTILRYDIDTDSWANAGNLAVSRSDATAARVGAKIYIFGGCGTGSMLNSIEVYDPKTQTSTLLAVTLPTQRALMASATAGNEVHLTGGVNSLPDNYVVFNAVKGTVNVGTPLPTSCPAGFARAEHSSVAHGNRLYVIGGACPFAGTSRAELDILKLSP